MRYFKYSSVVATPVANINGGAYASPQLISLSCQTAGSTIYYTLDDSAVGGDFAPSINSIQYTTPFLIASSCTLRAAAYKSGKQTFTNDYVCKETYIILETAQTSSE